MKKVKPTPAHQAFRDDAIALLKKHSGHLDSTEMLALAAHLVGQIVALQDHRMVTPQVALEIVSKNLELGNAEAIAEVSKPIGSA